MILRMPATQFFSALQHEGECGIGMSNVYSDLLLRYGDYYALVLMSSRIDL